MLKFTKIMTSSDVKTVSLSMFVHYAFQVKPLWFDDYYCSYDKNDERGLASAHLLLLSSLFNKWLWNFSVYWVVFDYWIVTLYK